MAYYRELEFLQRWADTATHFFSFIHGRLQDSIFIIHAVNRRLPTERYKLRIPDLWKESYSVNSSPTQLVSSVWVLAITTILSGIDSTISSRISSSSSVSSMSPPLSPSVS